MPASSNTVVSRLTGKTYEISWSTEAGTLLLQRFTLGLEGVVSFLDVVSLLRRATYETTLKSEKEPHRFLFLGKTNQTVKAKAVVYEILVRLLPESIDGSLPRCEVISCEPSLNARLIELA
jgi:hypothetical protein